VIKKTKAPVLWILQYEGVDESGRKHRGIIGNTMATQSIKWQQKRSKTDDGTTPNVNHGLIDGTQGAKTKSKNLPSSFKNKSFSLVVKNKLEFKIGGN
jgi:hypothetical protein